MAPGPARLVLNKRALCGLNVRIWDDQHHREIEGLIFVYDEDQDSFIIVDSATNRRFAAQFDQFTVLEEQQQLVLSVTKSAQVPISDSHINTEPAPINNKEELLQSGPRHCDAEKLCKVPSTLLAAEVSQQLTGMVGQCFSQSADGFTPAVSQPPAAIQHTAAGDGTSHEGVDSMLYWGSPIRCDNAVIVAALPSVDGPAAAVGSVNRLATQDNEAEQPQPQISATTESKAEPCKEGAMLATDSSPQDHRSNSFDGSPCLNHNGVASQSENAEHSTAAATLPASASYSSFREISRMISATEPVPGTPIPIKHSNSGKQHPVVGHGAHLLDEAASWGTPRDGSAWGTPREQQLMEVAFSNAAARLTSTSQPPLVEHVTAGSAGQPLLATPDNAVEPSKSRQQIRSALAASQASADLGAAGLMDDVDGLETDFMISVGVYEQETPHEFGTRRSRELYRIPSSEATDAGMMVDIPQPFSSRRASRTSVRNMLMGSDPGVTAAAGGLPAAGELRRAGSGLSSSRRTSRTTSSRLNADQGVSGPTPDSGLSQHQPQSQPGSQGFSLSSSGVPVHVPGPSSRRTSRTLSGRLPLDQDGAVLMAQLPDDCAPDVLTRPVTATSVALETIVSRHQSSNGVRPGTPDSDGFGYSEFEGIEPLVPPEVAQLDAIVEQAALHSADAVAVPAHQSHRHHRRSVRNMGAPAAHRPSMRISDQDDHGVISSPGSGAVSSRNHVGELQSLGPGVEEFQQSAGHDQHSVIPEAATPPQHLQHSNGTGCSQQASHQAAAECLVSSAPHQVESDQPTTYAVRSTSRLTSLGKIHQVAAAAAEAAAAAVGLVRIGTAGKMQDKQGALEAAAVDMAEDAVAAGSGHTTGTNQASAAIDGSFSADSFSCPPFMPLANHSPAVKSNPFADPDLFYSTIGQQDGIAAAYITGNAEATAEPLEQADSSGCTTAVLNRGMLPADGSGFSEWGSGRFSAHISSGIDTPTGSGIFKTNPFAEESECGSATSSHLDGFCSGPGPGKGSVGASRMAREAAAAAALIPFSSMSEDNAWKSSGVSISEITPASDDEFELAKCLGNPYGGAAATQQGPTPEASSTVAGGSQHRTHAAEPSAQQEAVMLISSSGKHNAVSSNVGGSSALMLGDADKNGTPSSFQHALTTVAWRSEDDDTRTPAQLEAHTQGSVLVAADGLDQQFSCGTTAAPCGDAGLVRRPASRTLSQNLSRNAVTSSDGIVMLPEPHYNYGDDDHQPLVHQSDVMSGYTPGKIPRTIAGSKIQTGHVLFHIMLITSAQWYDVTALVVLGGQLLAAMANPQLSKQQQTSSLFCIFAAGHTPWLVGCFLWPWIAGRVGAKSVLAWTVGFSAFGTALIGCMPAYSEGAGAGIAIIAVLRILSGLSMSNQAPAALSQLSEPETQQPHLHTSLVMTSMACGALVAGAIALFLALVLSEAQLQVFGWRLLLVASLVVNGISGWLRGFVLQDTEQHSTVAGSQDRQNSNVWRVVRSHASQVLMAVLLQLFATSGLYLLTAWMPVYFIQYTGLRPQPALAVYTLNTALLVGCIPLGGFLADQYGRTSILLATCAAAAAFAYPAWLLFSLSVASVSWFAHFTLVAVVGLHCGALGGMLVELFPRGVRCSALTLSCMIPLVLFGSMVPLMALSLIQHTGSLSSPAILMMVTAVITSAGVMSRETRL